MSATWPPSVETTLPTDATDAALVGRVWRPDVGPSVVAVRPGQTYSRTDSGTPGDSFETTVTGKTVYVDVK